MKTTEKDYDLFRKTCSEFAGELGLKEWSIDYQHKKLDNCYAQTNWRTKDMLAVISFCTDWDTIRPKTDEAIKSCARHEVLHVLLAPLISEAEWRYTSEDAIQTAEHSIIRRLEGILS